MSSGRRRRRRSSPTRRAADELKAGAQIINSSWRMSLVAPGCRSMAVGDADVSFFHPSREAGRVAVRSTAGWGVLLPSPRMRGEGARAKLAGRRLAGEGQTTRQMMLMVFRRALIVSFLFDFSERPPSPPRARHHRAGRRPDNVTTKTREGTPAEGRASPTTCLIVAVEKRSLE